MNPHRINHVPVPAEPPLEAALGVALAIAVAVGLVISILQPLGAFL